MVSTVKHIITLRPLFHNEKDCIGIYFPYNQTLIKEVKAINGVKWSQSNQCWYIINTPENFKHLLAHFKGKAWLDIRALQSEHKSVKFISTKQKHQAKTPKKEVQKKIEEVEIPYSYKALLERQRYSPNTIKTYCSLFEQFLRFYPNKHPNDITEDDIRTYQDYLVKKRKVSISTQNQAINAIKFYYEKVKGGERKTYYIERPKRGKTLPNILSENEVLRILKSTTNLKHKSIIACLYSSGLRIGELLNLRISDVSFDKNIIFVRGGKGNKDRTTILSHNLKFVLKKYISIYKPNYWLFEGPSRKKYSRSSVNQSIKKSAKAAGITQRVSSHTFRHSFATHLLEKGVDLRYIQTLLGHSSSKTTEIYTYVSNKSIAKIKSPLDEILEDKNVNNNKLKNN